jgi:hypothetical protein
MTYRELKQYLDDLELMDPSALDLDIAIHDMVEDEFYSGVGNGITFEIAGQKHDVLDEGHPIICLRK